MDWEGGPVTKRAKRCALVSAGSIGALDVQLRQQGVSDNDRHEILRFASVLNMPDEQRREIWRANEDADTIDVDIRKKG
jgi:hypothetical protein